MVSLLPSSVIYPTLRSVQGDAYIGVLGEDAGDKGLGQNGKVGLSGCQQRGQLHCAHSYIPPVTSVPAVKPFSPRIWSRALFEVAPFPVEVRWSCPGDLPTDWMVLPFSTTYSTPRVLDARYFHLTLGLVVEHRGHIGGNSGDIQFTLDEQGDLIGGTSARVNS